MADSGAHILVFPYPAQGHMLPLLDLSHHLATKHNLTITILITPKNLHLLNPLLSSSPAIKTLILSFPSHPLIPAGVENTQDLPDLIGFSIIMQKALSELHNPIADWFRTHPSPPVAIISDIFLGWTHELASQLGIKRLVFSLVGALSISLYYSLFVDLPPVPEQDENAVVSFPRTGHTFFWRQVSPLYRSYVKGDPIGEFIRDSYLGNVKSWGLILNTFNHLEQVYLNHLMKDLGNDRVWAVGPVLSPTTHNRGGKSSIPVDDIISWLDKRDVNSVVYIGFGSQVVLTDDQMEAIALGLEESNVHFIWSVKEPVAGDCKINIPVGFEARLADRGMIIKGWAPQIQILSHRTVGAYLTHGGWNSMLEGLVIGGVLLLMWPMAADHFWNATLLVDEFKAAVRVCEGAKTVPDPIELAKIVAGSVNGNEVERERAMELCNAAMAAIDEGGSSIKDLDGLVEKLSGLRG